MKEPKMTDTLGSLNQEQINHVTLGLVQNFEAWLTGDQKGNMRIMLESGKAYVLDPRSITVADVWGIAKADTEGCDAETWLRLCASSTELIREYDRLKGTNLARQSDPITQMVNDATGKHEADAKDFFEFCMDLHGRVSLGRRRGKA